MIKQATIIALAATCLAGCVSTTINTPNPTATEQLQTTTAAEAAVEGLVQRLALPAGSRVYIEPSTTPVSTTSAAVSTTTGTIATDRYIAQAFRDHLRMDGFPDVPTEAEADVVVSVRISADSLDDLTRVLGLPAMTVPTFQSSVPAVNVPELSIFSEHQREGIVQLYATAVRARSHTLVSKAGPVFAGSKITNRHILTGFVFGDELQRPGLKAETVPPVHP